MKRTYLKQLWALIACLLVALHAGAANDGEYYLYCEWNDFGENPMLAKTFKLEPTQNSHEYRIYLPGDYFKNRGYHDFFSGDETNMFGDGYLFCCLNDAKTGEYIGPGEEYEVTQYEQGEGVRQSEYQEDNRWAIVVSNYQSQSSGYRNNPENTGSIILLTYNDSTNIWNFSYEYTQNVTYFIYTTDEKEYKLCYLFEEKNMNDNGNFFGKVYLQPGEKFTIFNGYYFIGDNTTSDDWWELTDSLDADRENMLDPQALTWATVGEKDAKGDVVEPGYYFLEFHSRSLKDFYTADSKFSVNYRKNSSDEWTAMAYDSDKRVWYSEADLTYEDATTVSKVRNALLQENASFNGNIYNYGHPGIYPSGYFPEDAKLPESITIYVHCNNVKEKPYLYEWDGIDGKQRLGSWPGTQMQELKIIDGTEYYCLTIDCTANVQGSTRQWLNIIVCDNADSQCQTADITGVTGDLYLDFTVPDNWKTYYEENLKKLPASYKVISVKSATTTTGNAKETNYEGVYRLAYRQASTESAGESNMMLRNDLQTRAGLTYRTFSDVVARKCPAGVKAYYASDYDEDNNVLTLTKIASGVIPANTGVVLVYDSVASPKSLYYKDLSGGQTCYLPSTTSTETLDGVTNYLKPMVLSMAMMPATDGDGDGEISSASDTRNYYMVWYRDKQNNNAEAISFVRAARQNPSAAVLCRAYLALPATVQTDSELDSMTASIKSSQVNTSKAANAMRFVFSDGDEATGITNVVAKTHKAEDDRWFNLTGQQVASPGRGIYIHNGKKVVVR